MLSSTLINTVSRLCSNVAAKSTIGVVRTKVSLPYLDWDFGALEPPVSGQSEFHYSKHHQTYSNAYNFEIEQQIGTKSKGEVKRAIELQKNFKPIPEIAKKADSSKRIVIIGGSYAGINAAKSIFSRKDQSVNVTLISSSTNAYFNVSTPRLIVEPDKIDKTLFPVENTLKKYSNGVDYRFVLGKVVSTNFNSNSLVVEVDKNQKSIDYDYLIVASGSRTYNPAFKLDGNYQNTVASIKKLNRSTKGAKKIIILGGGATGVETAGELGFLYGKEKEIVLYTGSDGPLESFGDHKSKTATNKLAELGVQVVNNKRSSSLEESGSHSTVIFEDGSSEDADVVIPAYGLIPNSEFLDAKFLDSHGYLKTDEYLRVKGHNNVLGLGDILSISENSVADLNYSQMAAFESVVDREFFGNKNSKLKPYSPIKTTLAVPISRDGGVGLALGWSVPSFIIKFMKSKDFMISKASKMLA